MPAWARFLLSCAAVLALLWVLALASLVHADLIKGFGGMAALALILWLAVGGFSARRTGRGFVRIVCFVSLSGALILAALAIAGHLVTLPPPPADQRLAILLRSLVWLMGQLAGSLGLMAGTSGLLLLTNPAAKPSAA